MYLSVVVPVYNEYENIPLLCKAVSEALSDLDKDWELILVNDGSKDNSMEALREAAAKDPEHVRVIGLRRNFGQTAAIAAGVDHTTGEIIVLMDADLQKEQGRQAREQVCSALAGIHLTEGRNHGRTRTAAGRHLCACRRV